MELGEKEGQQIEITQFTKEHEESLGVTDGFILLLVLTSSQGKHISKLMEL